ncbi:ensconsin [Cyclopterus lumpus]|uniref:ensconsin n=1 Tax=Cyclopterus lumpus TaxID=8103 RepID=UPI001487259B|nr:ensconsin [Cyclopterus lumpus]
MPGSKPSMAVQEKHSDTPPSQGSTRTTESQKKRNASDGAGDNDGSIKPKRASSSVHKAAQICNAVANGPNIDERLKAARERREEHQKLLASREQGRLEREQRARRYHEQQLQERKDKLLNQRLKEERKRAAVEEKRKHKLKEEKERYECAVRRTVEKSQRVQQSLSLNSRGRKLTKNTPRRSPLTSWERNLVSRLLTPTCSYLARSKSAACQSGEEVSFHSMTPTTTTTITTITAPHKPQHHMPSAPPRPNSSRRRSADTPQVKAARQQGAREKNSNARPPAVTTAVKPAKVKPSRTTSPSPERNPRRSTSRHSAPLLQLELPSVPEEDVALCSSALSPGNSRPVGTPARGRPEKTGDENPPPKTGEGHGSKREGCLNKVNNASLRGPPPTAPQPPEVMCGPSAGTTDPGEASRLLAEKRREARLQREGEERERLRREEAERRSREELERKRADERARQQAEARRLVEEKTKREEEEQRRAEEERAEATREAALLQRQREEEQAKERVKAEQLKQERETLARKEEAARQARKKRLEEIMRRTRRTDSPDTKSAPASILPNEVQPKENTQPVHNGAVEVAVKPPAGTKTSQLELNHEEDVVPVVAFKERRSLRTLTGLEEIQSHQRAGEADHRRLIKHPEL